MQQQNGSTDATPRRAAPRETDRARATTSGRVATGASPEPPPFRWQADGANDYPTAALDA
jgi:hypothetical protein